MKKLVVLGMEFNLADEVFEDIEDIVYFCDAHEGYHVKPDGHANAMAVAEAMVKAIRDTQATPPMM